MAAHDHISTQFNVQHTRMAKGWHALTLADSSNTPLANVSFNNYKDDNNDPYIEIEYLKSNQEGKGHASTLMEHLYQRYPKAHVDWGLTVHPAATHLANKFETKHYSRTSYQQNDGEEGGW